MSAPLDPSSSIHILDKAKRNEIMVVRNDPMIKVVARDDPIFKSREHRWAASLERHDGGGGSCWIMTARAGFELQARWKQEDGIKCETKRTGEKGTTLQSGSRLTMLRSGYGSRLARSVIFHSSSSGGAELREERRPSTAGGSRGSDSGDIGWGAASMERQGPITNRTISTSKVVTSEGCLSSEASRMMVTPIRANHAAVGRKTTPWISEDTLSPSSSAACGTPLTPEHEVESERQSVQEPELVLLWEIPQMVPPVSNSVSPSSATADRVDENMRGNDRTRIQGMGEVRPLDGRGKKKGKGRASSPSSAGEAAATSRGGTGVAEDDSEWSCQKCTFINKGLFLQCDACGTERATKGHVRPAKTWGRYLRPKRRITAKSQQAESGARATPPVSVGHAASPAAESGPSQTAEDYVHRSGDKRRAGSNDVTRGSSLPSSPLAEAGRWSAPASSPPRTDEDSGSRGDVDGGENTKRRCLEESPSSTVVAGKGEGGRERQCVSDVDEEDGETELVEGTGDEEFSAPFMTPTVTGPFVDPSRPESLEGAPPVSPARSGVDVAVAQGTGSDPGTDAGHSEVDTVVQFQGKEGKSEEEEAKEDESVMDDYEYEEAEYDSNASLDY